MILLLLCVTFVSIARGKHLQIETIVEQSCHSNHVPETNGCRSLPLGHALLLVKLSSPQAIGQVEFKLDNGQDKCVSSTVSVYADVSRTQLLGSSEAIFAADSISSTFLLDKVVFSDTVFVEISCGTAVSLSFSSPSSQASPNSGRSHAPSLEDGAEDGGATKVIAEIPEIEFYMEERWHGGYVTDITTPEPSASPTVDVSLYPEYMALQDLYYATNGDGWYNNANWLNGDVTFKGWVGVDSSCTPDGCTVDGLNLYYNNLVGAI